MTIREAEAANNAPPVNVNGMIATYDTSLKDDTADMNNNNNNNSGALDRARTKSTLSSMTSRQSAQTRPEGAMMMNGTSGTGIEDVKEQQEQQFQQSNAGFSSNNTPRRRKKQ